MVTDLWRYSRRSDLNAFLRALRSFPGFRYTVTLRAATWATALAPGPVCRILRGVAWRLHSSVGRRAGWELPIGVRVGPGLFISPHPGGLVVHPMAELGANCTLGHGVTIGETNRGARRGVPKIGDNVYIAAGAKVIGRVIVGSHAIVGANCVVTRDVAENGVVVGLPGKVISSSGSAAYVHNIDWPEPASYSAWQRIEARCSALVLSAEETHPSG